MYTKYIRIYFYAILVMALPTLNSYSQVTIGSSIEPREGSLLDLKEYDNNGVDNSTATKGLLLPRVTITGLDIFDDIISGATDQEKLIHAGLVVYNVFKGSGYNPGAYMWDGEKWMALFKTQTDENGTGEAVLDDSSNSFILKPATVYQLPITKAVNMWKSSGDLTNTNVLDDLSTATITTELLWQDRVGVVTDLPAAVVDVGGVKFIEITIGTTLGNALVAVRISGSDGVDPNDPSKDPIRWSWHLWVTDYEPDNGGLTYNLMAGGESLTIMDRELGAISTAANDTGIIGVVYQWGRKDPFVTFESFTGTAKKKLYDIMGNQINSGMLDGITIEANVNSDNLPTSVKTPQIFYTGNPSWCTNLYDPPTVTGIGKELWTTRADGKEKTLYDPCPLGWRIPYDVGSESPFTEILTLSNTPSGSNGTGFDFGTALGYVDGMGGRGELGGLGFRGAAFWWGGSLNGGVVSPACINFIHNAPITIDQQPEAAAGYVRCIKDN